MTPTPEERRIREIAAFEDTAHADDIRELLAEYDRRADRDQLAEQLAIVTEQLADEEAVHEQWRWRLNDADQVRAALTELRAASRGLAFFDQIKCARWNAAYQQATQVLGLEAET